MSENKINYAWEQSQNRENIAIRNLMATAPEDLARGLGLSNSWWAIIQFQKINYGKKGDVDILFGNLNIDENYGINWPPSLEYLVACEVKCAYLDPNTKTLKSTKQGKIRDIQSQLDQHIEDGYNRVALVDLIVHAPSSGVSPWINALSLADNSLIDAAQKYLPMRFQANYQTAGHFCASSCPIYGNDEAFAGSISTEWRKTPPLLNTTVTNSHIQDALTIKFNQIAPTIYYHSVYEEYPHRILEQIPGNALKSTMWSRIITQPTGIDELS